MAIAWIFLMGLTAVALGQANKAVQQRISAQRMRDGRDSSYRRTNVPDDRC